MSSSRRRASRLSFFHLNDSEGEMGSNKDRHTLIGEGHIGVEAFRELMHDPRLAGYPDDPRDAAVKL